MPDSFEYKEDMRTDFLVRENKSRIKRVYKFSYLGGQERYLQKAGAFLRAKLFGRKYERSF